jgi:hypothetical protein
VLAERNGRKVQMTFHIHPEAPASRLRDMVGAELAPEATFAHMTLDELRAWARPTQVSQLSREATQALLGEVAKRLV